MKAKEMARANKNLRIRLQILAARIELVEDNPGLPSPLYNELVNLSQDARLLMPPT